MVSRGGIGRFPPQDSVVGDADFVAACVVDAVRGSSRKADARRGCGAVGEDAPATRRHIPRHPRSRERDVGRVAARVVPCQTTTGLGCVGGEEEANLIVQRSVNNRIPSSGFKVKRGIWAACCGKSKLLRKSPSSSRNVYPATD